MLCGEGEAYCWMECLKINDQCLFTAQYCAADDGHVCCSGDQTPDMGCKEHDDTCKWKCKC